MQTPCQLPHVSGTAMPAEHLPALALHGLADRV